LATIRQTHFQIERTQQILDPAARATPKVEVALATLKDSEPTGIAPEALYCRVSPIFHGGTEMIRGIHHTAISTADIERSLRFYCDLLGFELIYSSAWQVGTKGADRITGLKDSSARLAMLKAGNACIEIFQYSSPQAKSAEPMRPVCDHGITHICLDVADIDAEYERLKNAGMMFHCPPQGVGGLRATYGRDPDGNVVELLEVTDVSSPMALNAG
jgi:catechol 2,3-dioxygenase-like lactoylglutathione lyase family enzyme